MLISDLPDPCSAITDKRVCLGDCAFSNNVCAHSKTFAWCGEHQAPSCAACPNGHGSEWCSGECTWNQDQCVETSVLPEVNIVSKGFIYYKGFCVKSNGHDQNDGVIKLQDGDFGPSEESMDNCLDMCITSSANVRLTGCEAIWDQGNRGCYVHTMEVAKGNNVDRHACWIVDEGWTKVYGHGSMASGNTVADLWKSIDKGSYVRRICLSCSQNKDVIYKRITQSAIDYKKLFLSDWFHNPQGGSNNLGSDFKLFSNMNDAENNNNAWTFCNYDDHGIGFPRDCGPNGHVPYTWNSMNRGGQADYAYYVYMDKAKAQEYPGWSQVFGRGDMTSINTKPNLWNSIEQGSYVRRVCSTCKDSHKDIIYKRLTAVGSIDFEDLFLSNWFDHPNGGGNVRGSDFNLFSNMGDAEKNLNAWTYCNYDDHGIGFPRDCGPNGYVSCMWSSMTRHHDSCGTSSYAYYIYKDNAEWTQLYGSGNLALGKASRPEMWKSIDQGSYISRVCPGCPSTHQYIIYKRITSGVIDYKKLFLSDWFSHPHGGSNNLGSDFSLFSSMEDAKNNNNAWTFCNYNDHGIGFPRDCGPNGYVPSTWNSMNRGGQVDYAYFLFTGRSHEYTGWTQVFGRGSMASLHTKTDIWNSINQGSYVRRVCPGCQSSHKDIIYKRLAPVNNIDFKDLFLSNWFDDPNGGSNILSSDFSLFSNMEDAENHKNAWTFCNYNDPGIGFPRDCGPNGYVACTWGSITRNHYPCGATSYAYYIYTGVSTEKSEDFNHEKGFCVTKDGHDQNTGVVRLQVGDFGPSEDKQKSCLDMCISSPMNDRMTGCEAIWDQGNRGCYMHTMEVARGNSVDRHACWVPTFPTVQVTFTVKRSAGYTNVITFTKESGYGPYEIVFGPNPSEHSTKTVTADMSLGTSYVLKSFTVNGRTNVGELRLNGNQLQLEDIKGNNSWDDIVVTPSIGSFTSKNRFTLTQTSSTHV
jgi:hypothetical protein